MTMHVHHITVDAADALGLATFWSRLLGWHVFHDEDPEVVVAPHFPYEGTALLFIPVPEGKTAKNRLHLDVAPDDLTREEAVAHAEGLGARVLADHRRDDGTGWVVMADPEGNEFCLERGPREKGPVPAQTWRLG